MANEIEGALQHAQFYNETTWGTKPGSPDFVAVPVNNYDVEFNAIARQGVPFTGLYQRKHNRRYKGLPQGPLSGPLYGYHRVITGGTSPVSTSLAEYMCQWGFADHEIGFARSKGAQWAEGPDTANREHNGLRIDNFSIQGDEDSGLCSWNADVKGKTETALVTAQTIPTDHDKLVDMEFPDAVLTLDTVATAFANFNLGVTYGLKERYNNARNPQLLFRTQRAVTFSFTLVKNSDTYQAAVRLLTADQEYDIQLDLSGLHNGSGASGNQTDVTFDMPRCSLLNPDDARAIEDLTMTQINLIVLKPDTAENDLIQTWALT